MSVSSDVLPSRVLSPYQSGAVVKRPCFFRDVFSCGSGVAFATLLLKMKQLVFA